MLRCRQSCYFPFFFSRGSISSQGRALDMDRRSKSGQSSSLRWLANYCEAEHMQGDLEVTDGAAAGAWIEPRLGGEFGAVTLQAPRGYEAYARVFHPATDSEGKSVRWADVAKACGKVAHCEMQWHALVTSP